MQLPPGYAAPWTAPTYAARPATPSAVLPLSAPAALPKAPRLAVRLLLPTTNKPRGDERLAVELRDVGGRVLWRCERIAPISDGALGDWCPLREALKSGTHAMHVSFRASAKSAESTVSQSFPVTLEELGVEVDIRLSGGEKDAVRLEELVVSRVLSAHPEVQLKREWSNPNAPLRYTLANGSAGHTLHTSGIQGFVMASIDRATDGTWVPHTRGIVCGAAHGAVDIAPGASVFVEEGHFVGPLRPLDEGNYRLRVRYTVSPDPASAPAPRAVLRQVHEVYDDVRIASDRLEPVEDIRDPFSCDPPFRVDLDGVRHIKPECLGY
jgi:hypothetical protein